jgi:hypothetical protein
MRRYKLGFGFLALSTLALLSSVARAQVVFTGTQITQNFDSLAAGAGPTTFTNNSTLLGWYADQTNYIGDDGNSTTTGLYSYGVAASSERALGGFTKGGTITVINYGVQILNTSGYTIDLNNVGISYTGEYWRKANNAA